MKKRKANFMILKDLLCPISSRLRVEGLVISLAYFALLLVKRDALTGEKELAFV